MGKALYLKLGIQEGNSISVINPPEEFDDLFANVPFSLNWKPPIQGIQFLHFFPKDLAELEETLPLLQDIIHKDGMIWVSWFKKASKILSDLNESIVRNTALNLKLVDVKKCSVNDRYSGLKLVIRKHLR